MAGVIISRTTAGLNGNEHALIGKLATPLKMLVLSESDRAGAKEGAAKWLCTTEESDRFAESAVAIARPSGLSRVEEGDKAPLKGQKEVEKSTIYMYQYMTKQIITASELEDCHGGVTAGMKRTVKKLITDYDVTRNRLAVQMLIGGTKTSTTFDGAALPLPAPGGNPLFYLSHPIGDEGDVQSNIFYNTRASGVDIDSAMLEQIMGAAVVKLGNLLGNDGFVTGYTADTIIMPYNNAKHIAAVRKAAGSELSDRTTYGSNAINIQCGNWTVIGLYDWRPDASRCPMIFMSSVAREELMGNMLYRRSKYKIRDWIDNDSWNYCWSGRTRLGIGHHTYRHAIFFESLANGTTTLFDGQTASSVATSVTL